MKKRVFKRIFVILAILLSVMPVLALFSSLLTSIFNHMEWYVLLQKYVVPFEARLVAVLVKPVGINALIPQDSASVSLILEKSGEFIPVAIEWNCIGWQSMLLLVLTFSIGFRGNYKMMSKMEAIVIGVLGTFLVNLFRMALIVVVGYYWNSFAVFIIHDYFATFVAFVWMVFFWWFVYGFVLEEKA